MTPDPELDIFRLESSRNFLVAIISAFGVLLCQLDAQLTAANLRYICGGLGFTPDESTWSSAAYLWAQLTSLVVCAGLIKTISLRSYLLIVAALYASSQVLAGQAVGLAWFIVARLMTGFCAGGFNAVTLILVLQHVPRKYRLIAFLLFGLPSTLFVPVGYWLGGYLVNNYTWRDIYCVSGIPGVLVWLAYFNLVPSGRLRLHLLLRTDWSSVLVLLCTLASISLMLNRGTTENWFDSPFILSLALASFLGLLWFLWAQQGSRAKLLDLSVLKNMHFAAMIGVNFMFGALLSYTAIIAGYLQNVAGYDSEQVGGTIIWAGLCLPFIIQIMQRFDHRLLLLIGLLLISLSGFANGWLNQYLVGDDFFSTQVIRAIGQTLVLWPLFNMVIVEIPDSRHTAAATFYGFTRALGIAVSAAVLGGCLTWRDNFHSQHAVERVAPAVVQQRQRDLSCRFVAAGSNRREAAARARVALRREITVETRVRAYSDLFWLMGAAALAATVPLLFVSGNNGAKPVVSLAPLLRFRRTRGIH